LIAPAALLHCADHPIEIAAMLRTACIGVLALLVCPAAWAALDCSAAAIARQPLALPATVTAPLSNELQVRNAQLGMPSGVLASTYSFDQSADRVVQRLRIEGCQNVAAAVPAATPTAPAVQDAAAYKPQTEFDNTPWRFDMSQNGKRMTAEEFDAWMKARGVRVVQARPAPAAEAGAADPEVK
jgi:hypothetical protein